VTWVSARCELIPKLEEPFFVGANQLDMVLDAVHWLIRLRLVNECLILNNTNLARICAKDSASYRRLKIRMPPWILFFNVAAYDFLPEERIAGQVQDIQVLAQRLGIEVVKSIGEVNSDEFLRLVQYPSMDPYWKLRYGGNCQDIFFLTVSEKLESQIKTMFEAADAVGYSSSDIGIYLQPIVQGVNYHCEFNLFYNPQDPNEARRIRELTATATNNLLKQGAFFSRPYGENARLIMNRDAASLNTLKKVKAIVDPITS